METPLIYPVELRGTNRPMMRIKCVKPNKPNKRIIDLFKPNVSSTFVGPPDFRALQPQPIEIYVPIPVGISFEDAASYNEAELNILGGLAMNATRNINAGANADGVKGALQGALKTGQDALGSVSTRDIISGVLKGAEISGIDKEITSGVAIGMGTTLNKNVTTEFTGVGVRSFSFVFKFVSKSEEETLVIKSIIETFRSNLYPVGNFISLQYPPTWNIQFLNGENGEDIPYLPKIFECYLKGLTTDFNPSANIWHGDNAPLETDITVAFIESRALTYDDIKLLDSKPYEKNDFLNSYQKLNSEGTLETLTSPSIGTTETPTNTETKVPVNNTGGGGFGATQNVYGIGASR